MVGAEERGVEECAVVGLKTCTLIDAPETRSPSAQFNVCCAGAVPLIEQVPGPVYAGLIDQLRPVPVGSGSEMVTPVAFPGPALLTVMVKTMVLPELTEGASGVLVTDRLGVVKASAGAASVSA